MVCAHINGQPGEPLHQYVGWADDDSVATAEYIVDEVTSELKQLAQEGSQGDGEGM